MNALRALLFIASATLRNLVLRQLRRLRRPRYLVATAFGCLYVWGIFARHGARPLSPAVDLEPALVTAFLLAASVMVVLYTWIFGGDEGAVQFSEAEIQFLFPAPLTRIQLIHYKLARTLLFSGFTALLLTLGLGSRLGVSGPRFFIAAWMGVATLGLHNVAASLTRASLLQRGTALPLRRMASLVVPVLLGGSIGWALWRAPPLPAHAVALRPWFEALVTSGPVRWATLPFRPMVELALRPGREQLGLAMLGALGSLGLHYVWALATGADFHDGALAAAERRGRRMERRRMGQLPIRAARAPWRLGASGSPVVAIIWKNLTAGVRLLSLRLTILVGVTSLAFLLFPLAFSGEVRRIFAGGTLTLLAAYFTLFGTQVLRLDFRLDLPNMDVLRTLPLRGWQLAAGEVLAPVAVLAFAQWVCLAAAAAIVPRETLAFAGRLGAATSLALVLPPLNACLVIVQNAAALIFPSWVATGVQGPRGIEAMGQRLLTLAGTLLVVGLALVPAAVAGGGVVAAVGYLSGFGAGAAVAGAAGASAVLAMECAFGIALLGRLFERFDLALS